MNITRDNVDALNATLKVSLVKEDYEAKVESVLKDMRKKARIDGFRPGMVPTGLIKRMYGKQALAEEVNKIVAESVYKHIADEKLDILGEPLPSLDSSNDIDWDNPSSFEFTFDLGLRPQFEISFGKKDKVTYYEIIVNDESLNKQIDSIAQRYGSFKSVDEIITGEEMVKADLIQLDEAGAVLENGIESSEVSMYIAYIKDEEIKKPFIGAKVDSEFVVDLVKAFPNDAEIAAMLKIKSEEVKTLSPMFKVIIRSISKYEKSEINQEFFDKIYPAGEVSSEEEMKEKLKLEIRPTLDKDSEYKFMLDAKEFMVQKLDFALPADFLKRWIFVSNEGKFTMEQIEKDFEGFEKDLRWQLIVNKIVKDNEIKVDDEEILAFSKDVLAARFRQYGYHYIPDDQLTQYAMDSLKNEDERRKLFEKKYEEKAALYIKENVNLDKKEVTTEEFDKLFETKE
jgi:trigger factor